MKIVFLDVDGVLNHMDSQVGAIEDMAVFKLKNILNETKAQVVLSSDWRLREADKTLIIKRLELSNIFIIGFTPYLPMETRGKEIDAWLNEHKDWSIENFIILDDRDDMDPHSSRLVQTTIREGLTWDNTIEAINKLQEKRADFNVEFFATNKDGNVIMRQEIFSSEAAVHEFLNKNYISLRDIQWSFYPHQGSFGGNLYRGYAMVKQI